MQATEGAKAALPLPHAHVGYSNTEIPVKSPPYLGKSFGLHETLEYFSSILLLTLMEPAGTSCIRALHLSEAWLKLLEGGWTGRIWRDSFP